MMCVILTIFAALLAIGSITAYNIGPLKDSSFLFFGFGLGMSTTWFMLFQLFPKLHPRHIRSSEMALLERREAEVKKLLDTH